MKTKLTYFFKLIRTQNLVMTIAAVWLHWYFLILLPLHHHHASARMDHAGILCLGLALALVMGAGYVINDIFDVDIDAINKGQSQILNNHISLSMAGYIYWWLNGMALVLSVLLGAWYQQLNYILLLPLAVGLLYYYSKSLKKQVLLGNLLIAVLCGGVLLLPQWIERQRLIAISPDFYTQIRFRFLICFSMASLLTLIRELIKDQEDIEGDRMGNAKTMPVVLGKKTTDRLISLLLWISIGLMIATGISIKFNWLSFILITGGMSIPLGVLVVLPVFKESFSYTQQSRNLKYMMALGMILLPIALKYLE